MIDPKAPHADDEFIRETPFGPELVRASVQSWYLEDGREKPDPTPVAPPIGWVKQPSLAEQIRTMVRSERLAQEAAAAGAESFDEADDFDVGDDDDLGHISGYENDFDPVAMQLAQLQADQAAHSHASNATPDTPGPGPEAAPGGVAPAPAPAPSPSPNPAPPQA